MIKFIPGFATTSTIFENQIKELSVQFPVSNLVSDYLVAWSMGVYDAVRIYFENKSVIKKMVLVSGTPKFLLDHGYTHGLPDSLFRNLEKKLEADLEGGLEYFYRLVFNGKTHPQIRRLPAIPREKIFADLGRLKNEDIRHLLPQIEIPVLLIHGSLDQICLPSASAYMAALIPNARLEIFEGSAHAPFLDDPKRFNRLVAGFLKCR